MSIQVQDSRRKYGPLTAVLALLVEHLVDSLTNLTLGDLDIVLGVTGLVHEGEEAIVSDIKL